MRSALSAFTFTNLPLLGGKNKSCRNKKQAFKTHSSWTCWLAQRQYFPTVLQHKSAGSLMLLPSLPPGLLLFDGLVLFNNAK